MVTWIDYVILVLYAISMVGIAIYTKNRSKSVDDFLHAGKKGLNGWMSAFAYGTTYFSAVIFVGYAGKFGSSFGLASAWIGIANAVIGSLVAWLVLAKRTKNMTARLESKTMPDFFEKRYGDGKLKIVSAIVIFVFLIPYSASVYSGLSSIFEFVFGIEGWIVMLALAALTAMYLFFGGYFATALSDFIQGIIMLIGVVLMVFCFVNHENVNWDISELVNDVNKSWFTFGSTNKGFFGSTMTLLSLIFLTSFGVWALPQTVHKYYAIRDKRAIKQGTVVSTVFALVIGFGAYFVGALYKLYQPDIEAFLAEKGLSSLATNSDIFIPVMLKLVIPTALIGIIAVLILSASMSTLSSVSLASASVVAVDLYKGKINKGASDKRTNMIMKALCVAFIVISVVLAILNEEFGISAIAYMMGLSWGTLAGCFIGPFVLGVTWKKATKQGAWASIVGSLVHTVALIFILGYAHPSCNGTFGSAFKAGVSCSPMIGSICMIFSVLVTVIVSLLTKAPSDEIIAEAFEKPIENEIK